MLRGECKSRSCSFSCLGRRKTGPVSSEYLGQVIVVATD